MMLPSISNLAPESKIIEEAARELSLDPPFIEKDWYVTQVLKLLAENPVPGFMLIFSGGTALSKGYGLLNRFSEDIDFRFMCDHVAGRSREKERKIFSGYKYKIVQLLQAHFNIPVEKIRARNGNRFFAIDIDYPIRFDYPKSLRPHIQIEFTYSIPHLAPLRLPVNSLINSLTKNKPVIEGISCIDPVENASDKISALIWRIAERVRGALNDDATIIRHLHDLSPLRDHALEHKQFKKLAIDTINADDIRSKKIQGLSLPEKIDAITSIFEMDKEYEKEYRTFVRGMSYADKTEVPSFGQAVENFKKLCQHLIAP